MICPRSHSQEAEKPSWNQGLTVPRSHIGMEWWEVSLRLESEAVDEVSAQHGLGVCPSRAAFPGSLTFQMPSDPLPCAPRIRYRDGLRAPSMVPASPLPGHRACPGSPVPGAPWRTQPAVMSWFSCLPSPLPSPPQKGLTRQTPSHLPCPRFPPPLAPPSSSS